MLGCTLLIMLWDGYWVLHPSKEEVHWQGTKNTVCTDPGSMTRPTPALRGVGLWAYV